MENFSFNPRYFFRISEFGGRLAVIFFPVSISISQGGLFLAVTGWLGWQKFRPQNIAATENCWALPLIFPRELKLGAAIYGALLLSLVVNSLSTAFTTDLSGGARFLQRGISGEFRDIGLIAMAAWALAYTADERGRDRIYRWLFIALMILIVTGLIAIFSKFRLARIPYHLMHGWEPSAAARLQHHAGTLFAGKPHQIHLYMPIGLMGTHLTFAALLSFVVPGVIFRVLDTYITESFKTFLRKSGVYLAILLMAGVILVLNNGRSAVLGLLVASLIGFYYWVRTHWRQKSLKLLTPLVLFLLAVALLYFASPVMHQRMEGLLAALTGQSKHTDWQRIFVWQGSLDVIKNNPIWGVGSGAFLSEINRSLLEFSQVNPRLWYAYEIIQRGHAHNDLFHLMAIGGVFPPLFYLALFGSLLYRLFTPGATRVDLYWRWGAVTIFFSGLFQCYFQDDEVLLPFWLMVGLLLRGTMERDSALMRRVADHSE